MQYDIIGDVHGHADKLEGLLLKLEYSFDSGVYQHEDRKAVFVGDLIDRGTQNRRVIEVVRNMVEENHACAIMGNHEYNAICYHTQQLANNWLRTHSLKNFKQHENFLKECPLGHDDTNDVIEWFKSLPLFMDLDGFRVVHACWDDNTIGLLKHYLNDDKTIKDDFLVKSAKYSKDSKSLFQIIEKTLKGIEIRVPEDSIFYDKDGNVRHEVRVRWWGNSDATIRDLAFGYDDSVLDHIPIEAKLESTSNINFYDNDQKPVFFGHYWLNGTPTTQQENVCCCWLSN